MASLLSFLRHARAPRFFFLGISRIWALAHAWKGMSEGPALLKEGPRYAKKNFLPRGLNKTCLLYYCVAMKIGELPILDAKLVQIRVLRNLWARLSAEVGRSKRI